MLKNMVTDNVTITNEYREALRVNTRDQLCPAINKALIEMIANNIVANW